MTATKLLREKLAWSVTFMDDNIKMGERPFYFSFTFILEFILLPQFLKPNLTIRRVIH